MLQELEDIASNDADLPIIFDLPRREKAFVTAHAESLQAIGKSTARPDSGSMIAPFSLSGAHRLVTEREATHRAVSSAQLTDMPDMIVHISRP